MNSMELDTIEEITTKINEIKLILSLGILSEEIIDKYEAKIEIWQAEIEIIDIL